MPGQEQCTIAPDRQDEQDYLLGTVFDRCKQLGPRSRAVLMARARGRKYWQIARDTRIFSAPVSRERVRQIEQKAIEFFRQGMLTVEGVE